MLEYNGVPFSAIGGIQAITGQKKNGKSFVLTQLMSAVLGQESERAAEFLHGLKVPDRTLEYLGHLPKVLYVDTEMERLYSAKVLRRVHWLCGWDMKQPNDRFNVLWLKTVKKDEEQSWKKRYRLIKSAIELLKPDIVFIDGVRDIVPTINDENNATELLSDLTTLAEEHKICVWNALHLNPRPGKDQESKMRGWLGTELGNKVSDTLISIKTKSASGITFTVKQEDSRGKDIDDWKFEVTDDAGKLGIPRIISSGYNLLSESKESAVDDSISIRQWIEEGIRLHNWPMTRSDIKKKIFKEIGGQSNSTIQQADLQVALNMGYLVESCVKSGNGSYMLQPPEDMPF